MIYYEIFLKKFLPSFRSALAIKMNEKFNIKESDIAKELGVTQAEVSKYLNRLNVVSPSYKIDDSDIESIAALMIAGDSANAQKQVCRICPVGSNVKCTFKI
ncbi:XRE family transcriptional regulator [Candidatus Mancarchaeum acidiphilum]|uniref:XRE family transcriptional regulator n=1 Tax=Candidatus Mancarchaeum acidiphilum TaxID=1920749 RepID=A0A218NNR4_9ARCH|nr:hypothetical protein [Candidatus Mancarchaeum acidiphilum]ASI14109.1 XRE family transcriptional regulator [Candidatus Mancarchaeum acidiphilum]